MPQATVNTDFWSNQTMFPLGSVNQENAPAITERSKEPTSDIFRYKVYWTSNIENEYCGDGEVNVRPLEKIVPVPCGRGPTTAAHRQSQVSLKDAESYRDSVKQHLEKHGIEATELPVEDVPSNYSIIDTHLRTVLAGRVKSVASEKYNSLTDGGRIQVNFDQEYVRSETYSAIMEWNSALIKFIPV